MDTTKLVNRATGVVVSLVAIFAAVISYYHIIHIGTTHGEYGISSPFTALSIDGTILASSLVLLYCNWQRLNVPWLARVMLWSGVVATLACNVGYGLTYGIVGALFSAWPAIAFVGSVETILQLGKIKRKNAQTYEDIDWAKVKIDYDRKKNGPIEVIKLANEKPEVSYGDPSDGIEDTSPKRSGSTTSANVRNVPSKKSVKASAYYDLTHKLPTIQSIQDELDCTKYEARQIWLVMRDTKCDMAKAILIREEAKKGGKGRDYERTDGNM